ncbi:MAG: 6-carboxytetrahydropterin synthase [Bacteroidales bacterium]|nr:6-carboxytetrahydropterin synthase [Bacteroidales bacterium]
MEKIRLTKEFHFEMAHALWNYDGSCKSIHGHSYKLFITLLGTPIQDVSNPKNGMVADFSDLKKWVKGPILDNLDHCLLISSDANVNELKSMSQMFDKMKVVDYQPTCENLLIDIVNKIKPLIPQNLSLFSVKLCETATSYAEWFASDNP